MKRLWLIGIGLLTGGATLWAQQPFKGLLQSEEEKLQFVINLYEESVEVPGWEDFGPTNGYLSGQVYGLWMVTSAEVSAPRKALLHLSNDAGSETQEAELRQDNDSLFTLRLLNGVVIKRVSGRKLIKIPSQIVFRKR